MVANADDAMLALTSYCEPGLIATIKLDGWYMYRNAQSKGS